MTSAHALTSAVDGLATAITHLASHQSDDGDEGYRTIREASIGRLATEAEVGVVVPSLCEVIEYAAVDFDIADAMPTPDLLPVPAACLTFQRPIAVTEDGERFGVLRILAWYAWSDVGLEMLCLRSQGWPNLLWYPAWNKPWTKTVAISESAPELEGAHMVGLQRVAAAAFTILGQRIISQQRHAIPRAARRRRQTVPNDSVTVFHLRRYGVIHEPGEGTGGIDHDHRWWVNGHWFRAAVGKGGRERRWTWRMGHIKGPEDKPFRPRGRVIVADR